MSGKPIEGGGTARVFILYGPERGNLRLVSNIALFVDSFRQRITRIGILLIASWITLRSKLEAALDSAAQRKSTSGSPYKPLRIASRSRRTPEGSEVEDIEGETDIWDQHSGGKISV